MPSGIVTADDFVSIIIICFNQSHYLGDAIESVLAQTLPRVQVIVVDDGSTDNTAAVAQSYPQAIYVYQQNQGISSARNTGWRASAGGYIGFLDADDRLLPKAAEAGLDCFRKYPESGFVFGRYHKIDADGAIISPPNQPAEESDFYIALLRGNLIGMQSTVLYPRHILERVGGFNERLRCCEDYELYLRISREFPAHKHDEVVAEYRRHSQNMSKNFSFMLETTSEVLFSQMPFVTLNPRYKKALEDGIGNWRSHYGSLMVQDFRNRVKAHGLDRSSIRLLGNLVSVYPQGIGLATRTALRSMIQRSLGVGS